jgi:hypothetical protein
MGYLPRALLAGGIGFAVSFLAACGGGAGLLSGNQAGALQNTLNQLSSAVSSHHCQQAASRGEALQTAVLNLPGTVNVTLKQDLVKGTAKATSLALKSCAKTTPQTTSTATTSSTATSTPTTTSTTTSTPTTTPTTPTTTPTTPTTPTTTPTTPTTPTTTQPTGGVGPGGGGGAGGKHG